MSNIYVWQIRKGFMTGVPLIFILMGLSGCWGDSGGGNIDAEAVIIARVNQKELTLALVKWELVQAKKKYRLEGNKTIDAGDLLWLKNQALNKVVHEELLIQEAKKQGVTVSDDEFQVVLQRMKTGYQEEQFQRVLEIEEMNENEWNKRLRTNLIIKKLLTEVVDSKITINDEDVLKYFLEHQEEFNKSPQIRAEHIMVDNEEEARKILKKLENNHELFSFLARKFSLGLEAKTGGDLGYLEAGQMPEIFDDVFKLKVNEISDIIHTPYGFHIFKVNEKIPDRQMSFDEARVIIETRWIKKNKDIAFREWLNGIKREASIEVDYKVFDALS